MGLSIVPDVVMFPQNLSSIAKGGEASEDEKSDEDTAFRGFSTCNYVLGVLFIFLLLLAWSGKAEEIIGSVQAATHRSWIGGLWTFSGTGDLPVDGNEILFNVRNDPIGAWLRAR